MAPKPHPSGSKNLLGASWAAAFAFGSTTAMKFIPAIYVSIVATAEPVGSAIVAWWLFDQTLEAAQIIGGLIVISGIVLALLSRPGHQLPATVE